MITWGMMLRKVPAIVRAPATGSARHACRQRHRPSANPAAWAGTSSKPPCAIRMAPRCCTPTAYSATPKSTSRPTVSPTTCMLRASVRAMWWRCFIENRPELLLNVLAVAKLGGICAMLNTAQTQAALVHSLNLAVRNQVAIPAERTWFVADQQASALPDGYSDLMAASTEAPVDNPPSSAQIFFNDPCFYIYTSGTTGRPRPAS
ncbi:AMP-binding enzyme domain-containing protein [Ditylenchus destructor]|nr:AMP-binding enzyme domain-containing protein [Ditylenchus destructor]